MKVKRKGLSERKTPVGLEFIVFTRSLKNLHGWRVVLEGLLPELCLREGKSPGYWDAGR